MLITVVVYGVVALIVKMDDIGLHLAEQRSAGTQRTGRLLVSGMPKVLKVLSTVGIVAMLWVGGHIILVGFDELGWHGPTRSSTTRARGRTTSPGSAGCSRGW